KVPEIRILEKMAELALREHYHKIIESEKIDAIGRPEISITKLARHNPLGFKIKTAVLPEIKLPDYKDVAKKIISKITDIEKNITVSDEDLENTIMDIRKSRAPKVHMAEHEHKEGEVHPEPELPEFNDAFVQALGPFKDIADFKIKLKENIKLEKENRQKEKTRLKIIEKIIDDSQMDLPEILVEVELDKILYKMESDITQMGLKFEDYLKHLNKTVVDLRKEFRNDAEKKAKLGLILNEIAKAEKITADPEQVGREVAAILEHYKDADPERARIHAENVLTNEKIFQFLESQ
ncbi:MAG: trigger factor, partial [Patescibacteria group bacterium]